MIDTLKYTLLAAQWAVPEQDAEGGRELEAAGFSPEQAELFVRSQVSMITDNVATRIDMRDISHRIDKMDQKFEARLKSLESSFDLKLERITNRLGIIVVSSMGLMITGLGVFQKLF